MSKPDWEGFGRAVLRPEQPGWFRELDAEELQNLGVGYGVLLERTVYEPCAVDCACADYHGLEEMKEGVTCYRVVEK